MPRKKLKTTELEETAKVEEATAKPTRRTKKAPAVEQPTEATVQAVVEEPEKPKRSRSRRTASVTPQPEPQPELEKEEPASKPRSRRKKVDQPKVEDVAAAPEEKAPKKSKRSPKAAKKPTVEPEAEEYDDLPMPVWRPAKGKAKSETASAETSSEGAETPDLAPRKARRGRRGETREAAEVAPQEARQERRRRKEEKPHEPQIEPLIEPEPLIPHKPLVPIPEDAPQVVLRNGVPTLVRKGRVYPPLLFFGSSSDERRAMTVLDEARMAGESGIHLLSHLVDFEVDLDAVNQNVQLAAYLLKKSLEVNPEAQVLFRVVFVAPKDWQQRYRDARFQVSDGSLAEPSVCDDDFWGIARQCLDDFTRKLRLLPQADSILGVHLERGEWFFAGGWGYDTSYAAEKKFRDWARTRYSNDVVALRAAWFDSDVDFDNITVPEYRHGSVAEQKFVRSSRKERRWVDYHLFLSDATVQRIGDLAYAVKEASEGYFLVGASYGYTFEWSHPASGHLSLGKLLRTPEIDFIAGPPSYKSREPGGAAPFPGPIDSFALNGKLYLSEEDFKTAIGQRHEPDDFNPVIKTPQALDSIHWRGAGAALAHGSGMVWMDLWGNGWLKTPTIWSRGSNICDDLVHRMSAPLSDPDVALFVDERALAYLVDEQAFSVLVQSVREAALRSGMSVGFYLLSDLAHREKFPESKLYIFLNAWDIRPELRSAIKSRLQKDNKVLFWLYAAGLFDSGRESLERAREVMGIALKPQPFHSRSGTTIFNRKHPLCEVFPERSIGGTIQLEPSYFAIPEEATILGEYSQTGLPSFVIKEFTSDIDQGGRWKSVFLGEPVVTPALLRALGQMAGAHVWNFHDDVVHVRPPFLTVHCTGTGQRTITLPSKWSAYNLQTNQWLNTEYTNLRFNATDGSTHIFLVGLREELEGILNQSPDDILKIDELPPKPDNTVRFDAYSFDVPIMKLGEWMEGSADDEMADDILLRPQIVLEEVEAETKPASKRRRRGRRGERPDGGGSRDREEGSIAVIEEEDLSLSVMFRKRE